MPRTLGSVEKATRADLARLPADLAGGALAASALELARGLDGANSLTSKSMAAKAHGDIMNRLRELAPPEERRDGLDDLSARRAERLAGESASANPRRS